MRPTGRRPWPLAAARRRLHDRRALGRSRRRSAGGDRLRLRLHLRRCAPAPRPPHCRRCGRTPPARPSPAPAARASWRSRRSPPPARSSAASPRPSASAPCRPARARSPARPLAAAMSETMSATFLIEARISLSEVPARLTSSTPSCTWPELLMIRSLMSLAACEERCARLRTSEATTAKPRPASPARAASTAALSASRLVCRAISSITPMMSEILREDSSIRDIALTASATTSPPRSADLAGADRELVGLLGVLGVLLHRRGDLLHRGGGLFQARRLLFGALRQVGGAGRDLAGGVRDLTHRRHDRADGLLQLGDGRVEVALHLLVFVGELRR